ncbi:unnamed protein product [Arctia plantaginis]|uniref:Small ribosomal subunit protein eS21 n=1 Tax=Arctia plantaginis TaxID=874455 RepID=A0A8S0YQ74_ARCPL|nr:unnamed protein product [Arctia plantaginis]
MAVILVPHYTSTAFHSPLYRLVCFKTYNMQNDAGEFVDLYCPRKCSASNRLIHAKDHASVQLVIADVDPASGRATESAKMYVVCGAIRRMGESDDCIVRLTKKDGILTKNY